MNDDRNTNDHRVTRLFPDDDAPASTIDVSKVLRRSRARRLPLQLGGGALLVLAVGGLAVGGFQALSGLSVVSASSGSAVSSDESVGDPGQLYSDGDTSATSGSADDTTQELDIKRAPAEKINLCTGTLAEVAPAESGLVLAVQFADAAVGAASVDGTVTMTNTGTATITGYTDARPAVTLSQNGIVLWHTNGIHVQIAREVSLAPGASMEYPASFTPVTCGIPDDEAEGFRDGLPALGAGEYQVSAAIDVLGAGAAELVTSPLATVTLK